MRLEDRVALITGGGTGVGAATARLFAREDAKMVVTGRRPQPIGAVAAETGGVSVADDTSDPAHTTEAVCRRRLGFRGASRRRRLTGVTCSMRTSSKANNPA